MAIQSNFPALKPTLLLDFANSRTVDPRITFTRASTATFFNNLGVMQTAASGVPRIDFNPTTLVCNGLLIEEQRTNLLTYSEQFDNAAWTKTGSSVTANAAVAPDGNLTAEKIVEDSANSTHQAQQDIAVTSGTSYTFSVLAKAAERSSLALRLNTGGYGAAVTASFNLSAQTATVVTAGTSTSASITAVGNGWFRCSLTSQATATTTTSHIIFIENPANTRTYTGDGTSGIFIWGAQLEAGSFATSYIPTVAAQVTRSADSASMTGSNFSSWYRADEGTLFAEVYRSVPATTSRIVSINDGTTSTIIDFRYGTSPNFSAIFEVFNAGVTQAQLNIQNSVSTDALGKYAGAYKTNDFAGSGNGAAVVTDTSGSVFSATQMNIGVRPNNTFFLNGHIRKLAFYPARLTNAQLQALTA